DLKHARGVDDNWAAQNDWREWELISGKTGYLDSMITNGSAATGTKTFSSSFINGQTFGFELLKQAGIPYTMILGNHDYDNFYMAQGTGRTATYYNYYFSSASYNEKFATNVVAKYNRNHSDFAQNNDTMMNVIYEIDATPKGSSTPVKYLVVALEFGPTNDMIAWANEIVSQPKYSGHRVIVNTHAMMYSDGEFMSDNSSWRPCDYGYSKDANVLEVNNGIDVYNKLIKGNDNMFMSSGGHISQETFMNRTDFGTFSNQVYSMLIDWQDTFNNRGDSLLLVAKVNENTKKITFKVYNPVLDEFYCVENQNMEWDFSDSLAREVKKDSDINYSKNNAKVGEKVEFTLNAQAGYVYAMPKVVDSFGNSVTVTKEGGNYYFTMPTSKVSISVDEIDVSTISFPTSIEIDFGSSVDVSSYLNNAYTYTYSINGTSITNSGSIITAVSKGTSTLTVSIDGYGEVATCEFTTNEIVLDVPSSVTLEYDGTYDIKQYLPNTYTYTYSVQGESVSVSQGVISAISTGVSTLTISINGYGEVATCTITVKEQPIPPASSSSSSSSISSSSSSSEPSSQETISSSSKEQSSSSKIESSSSQSVAISSSSAITSGGNQGGQGSATAEPSRGGCMANFGGGYTLILILVAVVACVVIFKKKA
ncbi:MAG: metallophosphoesterase, partial [Clostridia bacterium]|nr:metallophosphoesterase [Clostridia bacterium]